MHYVAYKQTSYSLIMKMVAIKTWSAHFVSEKFFINFYW